MRLALCDGQRLFTATLAALLERWGHEVIATFASPREALALERPLCPEAFITDLSFPGDFYGDGPVAWLTKTFPHTLPVVLTASLERPLLLTAQREGAIALVSKADDASELSRVLGLLRVAVDQLRPGDPRLLSPGVREALLRPARSRPTPLTQKESEVLGGLVRGLATAELATTLGIRVSTVRTHIRSILSKLGLHSRLELLAYAVREQLVVVEGPAAS